MAELGAQGIEREAQGLQYATLDHQTDTAVIGMWLFLASEVLFFGGLLMIIIAYRLWYAEGFAEAVRHTNLLIGTANTALLLTSSFTLSLGLYCARAGLNRWVMRLLGMTALLGVGFLVLKGIEYAVEIDEHLWPGANFRFPGADAHAAQLFYLLYFIMTGVHAVHLTIGIGLIAYVAFRVSRRGAGRIHYNRLEILGLYWSFVDIVWIFFYPLIYLVGRA